VLGVRPTGEGIRLLLLLAVMAFAAFNTRNNLIYVMFSVGLAGTLISVVAGWLSLRRLELEAEPPDDIYAASPTEERFRVRNGSRVFAGYGIQLEDIDFPGQAARASVGYLAAGETVDLSIEKVYPRRGVFASARMRLRTRFPFGFFETIRDVRAGRRLTVFPRVSRVDISFAFQNRSDSVPLRQQRGESEELLRLRDYVAGDNLHHIHWKSTAKLGRLMTREFSAQQKRRFSIVFDPTIQEKEKVDADAFETTVSAAASLASHLAAHGLSFSFASPDDLFPHDASREHLRGVLSYLAAVVPRPAPLPAPDFRAWIEDAIRGGDTVFLLRYRSVGDREGASAPQLHVIDPRDPFFQELRVGT
jgi:uncharacterized protein (DUF58 family)